MATIYIAHPDGEDQDATRRKIGQILRDIEKSGNIGISPLVVLRDTVDWSNASRKLDACFDLLKGCDCMWVMSVEVTEHMRREIEFACRHNVDLRFFDNMHRDLTVDRGWEEAERRLDLPRYFTRRR